MSARSDSTEIWVVGIDDTDMPDIGGTGRLARTVVAEVEALGSGRSRGVTRHQFFDGPGVPKTSHNSSAAIAFDNVTSSIDLFEIVCGIVARDSIDGSDPGVALGCGSVSADLVGFARRAQTGLVTQSEARRLGATHATGLVGLGGTEGGVIGALSGMALRIEGDDGRYVDLPGIREVAGIVTVADLLDGTGIVDVVDHRGGESLQATSLLDLGDWVRPRLIGGRPVLVAKRDREGWVNADTHSK